MKISDTPFLKQPPPPLFYQPLPCYEKIWPTWGQIWDKFWKSHSSLLVKGEFQLCIPSGIIRKPVIRKLLVFWCFLGVFKWNMGLKCVKQISHIAPVLLSLTLNMPVLLEWRTSPNKNFTQDNIFSVFYITLGIILNRDCKSFTSLHDLQYDVFLKLP